MHGAITCGLLGVALLSSAGAQSTSGEQGSHSREQHTERWKGGGGDRKPGQWLRKYNNLPPEQQERVLKQDPDFQKLPEERQQRLLERLRRFNQQPPEQRERMIQRMERFEQMSPEQRQRLQQFQQQLRAMPEDRRDLVRTAFRHLHAMTPEQRQQVFDSPRFKSTFSAKEQELIKSMAQSNIDE